MSEVTMKLKDRAAILQLRESILHHLSAFDDGDGMLSKDEILQIMHEPASKATLKEMNIDRVFMLALLNMFYQDGTEGFPIQGILELLLNMFYQDGTEGFPIQ